MPDTPPASQPPPPAPVPGSQPPSAPPSVPSDNGFPTVGVLIVGGLFAAGLWYLASESDKTAPGKPAPTPEKSTVKPDAKPASASLPAPTANPFLQRMKNRSARRHLQKHKR
jgi:hypothetical protein